ncbi:MAG: hypothetical protein K8S23_04980, partial [Candidatus Cloacimonetes bacterium]|nr:hypothetical protein [Candidatus Cloacimonadota bacterium]
YGRYFFHRSKQIKSILSKERKMGINSSFFLLTNPNFPLEKLNYFANEKYHQEIISLFLNSSINLQGSKESAESVHQLKLEQEKLDGFSANGFRIRYLNADYQKLFRLLEQIHIKFDSSIGFDGIFGYRAGISYPFQPYNIKENQPFNIITVPVVISDRAFYNQNSYKKKMLLSQINLILKNAVKFGSHINMNWHNHVFDQIEFPFLNKRYWQILSFSKNNNAELLSTEDFSKF